MIRVTTLVAVATALVLAASGCGGSKKSSSGSTSTVASGSSSSGSSSSGSSSSGSSGSSSSGSSSGSSSSGSSGSSGSGSTGNVSASCLNFAGTASKLGQALASGGSSQSGEELKNYFNALASKAPSDIKSSFQTLADAISKYADAVKKLNIKPGQTPNAADLQKYQSAVQSISTPDVQKASDKIQAWVKAGCHS